MKFFITFYLGKKSLLLQYKIITYFIKKFYGKRDMLQSRNEKVDRILNIARSSGARVCRAREATPYQ